MLSLIILGFLSSLYRIVSLFKWSELKGIPWFSLIKVLDQRVLWSTSLNIITMDCRIAMFFFSSWTETPNNTAKYENPNSSWWRNPHFIKFRQRVCSCCLPELSLSLNSTVTLNCSYSFTPHIGLSIWKERNNWIIYTCYWQFNCCWVVS